MRAVHCLGGLRRSRGFLPVAVVVVIILLGLHLCAIKHHTEHAFTRNLLQQPIDHRITRFRSAQHEHRRIGSIDQQIGIGENAERRRIDDDVIEHLARIVEQVAESRAREELSNVFTRGAPGQKM